MSIVYAFLIGLSLSMDAFSVCVSAGACRRDSCFCVALLALAIATSIDALSVGVGVAVTNVSIVFLSSIIGIVTMGMCLLGVYFGHTLGLLFGRFACIFGGLVICAIGLKILL